MQIKEYEAYTLKECLQQVRDDLGPDAVILETRKIRKGGVLGMGARDAVCLVAATGISVKDDVPALRRSASSSMASNSNSKISGKNSNASLSSVLAAALDAKKRPEGVHNDVSAPPTHTMPQSKNLNGKVPSEEPVNRTQPQVRPTVSAGQSAAIAAARSAYARAGAPPTPSPPVRQPENPTYGRSNLRSHASQEYIRFATDPSMVGDDDNRENYREDYRENYGENYQAPSQQTPPESASSKGAAAPVKPAAEDRRFALLEKAMQEIREGLSALHVQQQESHERTVSAVVSAVAPALTAAGNMAHLTLLANPDIPRFPDLYARLMGAGLSSSLAHDLLDALPDFDAWSEEAQEPLAIAALRDLIERRVSSAGPIALTPGTLKAVALIGPTGVGKTTTIAKLAAHFALVEKKRVALLTMDTYRIAAVEQLKIYSQILEIPIGVAYSQAEVAPVVAQYADYDLLLIDTAGRSQKNIMQVGELKSLLEMVGCETHLVLSAQTKESDMIESVQRFSAARVDRLIFSKLDETDSYGTLLNVADQTGIPLSYLTTGQKVPEDLELANGSKLAGLLLN